MPLSLGDEELQIVRTSAYPLPPRLRARFLESVADELQQQPILGPAIVYKICHALQKRYLSGQMDRRPAVRFRRRAD
jgi:hypothetical protein